MKKVINKITEGTTDHNKGWKVSGENLKCSTDWATDWVTEQLTETTSHDWINDRKSNPMIEWMIAWMTEWMSVSFSDRTIGCINLVDPVLTAWLADWLIKWSIKWLNLKDDWLTDWLNESVNEWMNVSEWPAGSFKERVHEWITDWIIADWLTGRVAFMSD